MTPCVALPHGEVPASMRDPPFGIMHVIRVSLPLLLSLMLVACSQPSASTVGSPDEGTDPPALATSPEASANAPANAEFDDYALTQRNVEAFFAAQAALAAAVEADPELDPAMNVSEEDSESYPARLENTPALRDAITGAGIPVRDYAWTSEHLMGALMAQAALDKNLIKELPEGVSQRNVDFVRANQASIDARVRALQD